ncbi:hypothetical protein C8F01DRAFT_1082705 [Mycena amicta]|nr:hypothetical protein C8F01DRAFT_1082705 [Mycena amicta]
MTSSHPPRARPPLTNTSNTSTTSAPVISRPPKAVSDAISEHSATITELTAQAAQDRTTITRLERKIDDLEQDNSCLEAEQLNLVKHLADVETTMVEHTEQLAAILAQLKDGGALTSEPTAAPKKDKDNAFNTAVRKSFLVAMGLGTKATYEQAAKHPSSKVGGGYIPDPENTTSTNIILRPDWTCSFAENCVWLRRMVTFTRSQVPLINPAFSTSTMTLKLDAEIEDKLEGIFKSIQKAFKRNPTACVQRYDDDEMNDGDDEAVINPMLPVDAKKKLLRQGRRRGRKTRKGIERLAAIVDGNIFPDADPESFAFFGNPAYQSTDESASNEDDREPAIDPETDDETGGRIVPPKRPTKDIVEWVSRPPTYRSDQMNGYINLIELHIDIMRTKAAKLHRNKPKPHPRICGEPKDVPLPRVRNPKHLIIREMVSTSWLSKNGEYDIPTRILPDDEVVAEDG